MVERWSCEDVKRLLLNKYVVIVGDSIQRGLYKDVIKLLQTDDYTDKRTLKQKGESTCHGDQLIEGGQYGKMHNGKHYREVRQYHTDTHLVTFYFITSCYSAYMETILEDFCMEPQPDIIFMSSCVWDITRNGPRSRMTYQKNLQRLANRLKEVLREDALFIWNTATPVSSDVQGGFLLQEISFMNQVLRHDVVEANFYAKQVMVDNDFDVLDLHFHFRKWLMLRERDGIHWNATGTRRMSNLVLDHVAGCLDFPLPRSMWDEVAHCLAESLAGGGDWLQGDRRKHGRAHTYSADDLNLPDPQHEDDLVDRGLDSLGLLGDCWPGGDSPEDNPFINALSLVLEFSENFAPFPDDQFQGPNRDFGSSNGQWSTSNEARFHPY